MSELSQLVGANALSGRPVQMVWSPADFAATAMDAKAHQAAQVVPDEFDRVKSLLGPVYKADCVSDSTGFRIFHVRESWRPAISWWYKGRHRSNRFSIRVRDLIGGDR